MNGKHDDKAGRVAVAASLLKNRRILKAGPSLGLYLLNYMRKFRIRKIGGNLIIHSHLPPLNSQAYSRFIDEHLLGLTDGPSHAQVGVTDACPQKCAYCYNRDRSGRRMDKEAILGLVRDLRALGVFWMGLTGGEPLLNPDLAEIVAEAAEGCAVKLFTTGCGLTPELAAELKKAGLFSVSVSLDDLREDAHDTARGYKGAFQEALRALRIFQEVGGLQVGVSAVLSRDRIRRNQTEEFLEFLVGLGLHEAWLSEVKPTVEAFWKKDLVIDEEDRLALVRIQDRYNREGRITVNYLGHFEGREHFGCNAGHKMIYVDAFGEVGPCVFLPLSFGNVREKPLREIWKDMNRRFPSEESCFLNKNYKLLDKHSRGLFPMDRGETLAMLQEAKFGPPAEFMRLYDRRKSGRKR